MKKVTADVDMQTIMHRWMSPLIFALAALCAISPLILHGCSCGHDFDFHLLSWMEAASQWQGGILKPVWAFTPAFNAGEPRLLLYPPLSWATGATLGLLLPWPAVPIAFTGLVLFLSGLSMYRLLRRWTSPTVATLGGCLYLVNPYMLFVAYERTAYAELMAAAWMPLLLAAMLRTRVSAPRVAAVVALLWLTNAPAAVVGCYSILLLGIGRLLLMQSSGARQRLRLIGTVSAGVVLGLLAGAFYLLPMAWEKQFVQLAMALMPFARPEGNFLFTVDADAYHTHVNTQASWIAVGLCAVAILSGACFLVMMRTGSIRTSHSMRGRRLNTDSAFTQRHAVMALLGFAAVILFLLSRWSAPVWHAGPELVFLQFPWRFLAVLSAVAVVLFSMVLQRVMPNLQAALALPAAVLIALLAGYFAGGNYFREACRDDESVQALRTQFVERYGVGATDEYTPIDADNDDLPAHLPPAWLSEKPDSSPGTRPVLPLAGASKLDDLHFQTPAAATPQVIILRLRCFPGWRFLRDGVEVAPQVRDDGLAVVALPAGQAHAVEVRYRTTTDQWLGIAVTLVAVVGFGVARRQSRSGIMGPAE